MNNILLSPLVAFPIYLALVGILAGVGRALAGKSRTAPFKRSTYASGEIPPISLAAPGYRPFFVTALFFAVLHLGALMIATSGLTPLVGVYVVGLIVALLALILG